ncbi:hypothetical protein IDM36_00265 [Enterobacter mori]|uniref:Apea-like HEPN domain-containing protein n=1 Tax=Enterobacter mori TaxID=539813 RepID=A0A7T0H0X0_9ENTR|nr:HEPN domain-containing protein [Enterobacter mori]QPK00640.1 hypothetical protein IDM36_00265 [Enterobacter mori]
MDEINFSLEIEFNVEVKFLDNKLFGKLIFSKETPAHLELIVNDMFFALGKECDDIIECEHGNNKYTLMGCSKYGTKIFPKFIIMNKPDDLISFNEIEVSISQLNVIFHDGYFSNDFENDKFISCKNQSNFEVEVNDSDTIKSISDYWLYWSEISHDNDMITKFTQRHIISIKSKKNLSYGEVIKEIRHVCLLFSLLSLIQIHVNFAWVVYNNRRCPIYFPSIKPTSSKKIEWYHSIINLKDINSDMWSKIINNSYSNSKFQKTWERFYGMLSYNSYWEYEFLGFMSILDYYLKLKYKFKNHKENTFKNKYIAQLSDISEFIKNFISLPLDKFQRLLNIRNGVAHSDPDKLDILNDISALMILKNRLIILLNYLALKDLGIEDIDYANSAMKSFNPTLLNAVTKKKWLAKIIGNTSAIILPSDNFRQLKHFSKSARDLIIISKKSKEFTFDEQLSLKLNNEIYTMKGKYSNICDYIDNELSHFINGEYISEYIHTLHIHTPNEDDFIEATSVYILNKID